MFSEAGQNAEEVCVPFLQKKWIQIIRYLFYNPDTFELDKYDHMTPSSDAALISSDHSNHVLVSKRRCFTFAVRCRS